MEHQHFIEIDGQQIPVTEEVYRAYKCPLWAEHKRKEREKRCRDSQGVRCTGDCSECDKQRTGSILSLDRLSADGFDTPGSADFTQLIEDKLLLEELHIALDALDALDRKIIDLFAAGKSEREIADCTPSFSDSRSASSLNSLLHLLFIFHISLLS